MCLVKTSVRGEKLISKTLIALTIAWPVLALMIHLLIPAPVLTLRRYVQTGFACVWLVLTVSLWVSVKAPTALMMGDWASPFGIAIVSDQLSNVMLVVFAIVAICINFYSYHDNALDCKQQAFYCGFWLLLLGVSGAVLTADIFNLYVWFEVILVSAFILLVSAKRTKSVTIMHYATMNIVGTLVMLLAVAFLYGGFGSLSYASIAMHLGNAHAAWVLPTLCLFVFAIALKGGLFPLYFWLPKAYPKPSASSTMLLSSLVTKAVMVVLLRLVWLWGPLHALFFSHLLLWVALATMFFGVLGAASQFRFKSILAFHIISQLGYILLAIVLPLKAAIIAAVYFLIHNVFVKTNLFMVATALEQHVGSDHFDKLGSVLKNHRCLAVIFFISAMSLAGFPPLSGFWGKLLVIKAALEGQCYIGATVAIMVSLFTLYSMVKIWRYVFCQKGEDYVPSKTPFHFSWALQLAILPLVILPLLMGLWPDWILGCLQPIAKEVSSPAQYIHLVLGGTQ